MNISLLFSHINTDQHSKTLVHATVNLVTLDWPKKYLQSELIGMFRLDGGYRNKPGGVANKTSAER